MNNAQQKILIITPGFPHSEKDTMVLPYLQDFVLALMEVIGIKNIKVIATQYPYTKKKYLWHGLEVYPSGGKMKRGLLKLFTLLRTLKRINHLLRINKYIIHSFWLTEATVIGQFAAKKYNLKHVATIMGQDAKPDAKHERFLQFENIITVALSLNQNNYFYNATGSHANYVIPLPLPEIKNETHKYNREIDLLFVGSFINVKRPEQFVEIVKTLKNDFPEIKALMIGEGFLMDEIKQLINKLNLNISLTGSLPREIVFDYMQKAKILIHTSEFEGQCLVFGEALAHGMYVLSYNVGRIEQTHKHIVCNSENELAITAYKLLQGTLNFEPFQSLNTKEIINEYLAIYNGEEEKEEK